jgi:hypothetical protein
VPPNLLSELEAEVVAVSAMGIAHKRISAPPPNGPFSITIRRCALHRGRRRIGSTAITERDPDERGAMVAGAAQLAIANQHAHRSLQFPRKASVAQRRTHWPECSAFAFLEIGCLRPFRTMCA